SSSRPAAGVARPWRAAFISPGAGRPANLRGSQPPAERVPALLHHGFARRDPDPGTASPEGADSAGSERLAMPVARRRPPGAGLRERRLPDAALQSVRVLRRRADQGLGLGPAGARRR